MIDGISIKVRAIVPPDMILVEQGGEIVGAMKEEEGWAFRNWTDQEREAWQGTWCMHPSLKRRLENASHD